MHDASSPRRRPSWLIRPSSPTTVCMLPISLALHVVFRAFAVDSRCITSGWPTTPSSPPPVATGFMRPRTILSDRRRRALMNSGCPSLQPQECALCPVDRCAKASLYLAPYPPRSKLNEGTQRHRFDAGPMRRRKLSGMGQGDRHQRRIPSAPFAPAAFAFTLSKGSHCRRERVQLIYRSTSSIDAKIGASIASPCPDKANTPRTPRKSFP